MLVIEVVDVRGENFFSRFDLLCCNSGKLFPFKGRLDTGNTAVIEKRSSSINNRRRAAGVFVWIISFQKEAERVDVQNRHQLNHIVQREELFNCRIDRLDGIDDMPVVGFKDSHACRKVIKSAKEFDPRMIKDRFD